MKILSLFKLTLLGVFLTIFINACSLSNDESDQKSVNQIVFFKSSQFNWKSKKVEVSFEDNFQMFSSIDTSTIKRNQRKFGLSLNNLKQGIIIKLKLIDLFDKSEKFNEIMLEPFDLSKGMNEFAIGYNNEKPYIIY